MATLERTQVEHILQKDYTAEAESLGRELVGALLNNIPSNAFGLEEVTINTEATVSATGNCVRLCFKVFGAKVCINLC